jgi:adenylate kinase
MTGETLCLVLLGPPGSGKGTQAALLARRLGIPAISTGDIVRAAIEAGSDLGQRVERIVSSGELVDDDTMGAIVRHRLSQDDADRGFLLDGYPRTLPQADTLASVLDGLDRELTAVILIEVPEEELVERMLGRGRADDNGEVIRHRLAVYGRQTEPLIEHYRKRDALVTIDGDQPIEQVNRAILSALGVGNRSAQGVGS